MKFSKFILAFAASFLILSQAGAATIVGNLMDIYGGGIDRTIKISPKSTPQAVIYNGTNYTVMDLAKTVSSTNSIFAVVLLGGIYNVDFGTVNGVATPVTKILVPPYDTNTYSFNYVANLATNLGTFVWTNSYGIAAGTNIVITTNGALLVINSAGAGTIYATNVSGLGTAAYSNATAFYLSSNPSSYVTSSVTNGLATTNYVNTATNGLPSGIWTLGTASQSNSTAFAPSSVTNLTGGQIATIAAAITNGQTGANLGYTVFTNSKYQALGSAPDYVYLNAGAGFNTANNFLGNTNYPEAQNTNMGIVFSPVVDNDNYLGAINSLGNIPRFLKFWWRYQDDIRYNTNLTGVPSAATLFKISKDLSGNGNDYVEAYNDLIVDRDLRVSGNIIATTNVYFSGNTYTTNHSYDASGSLLYPEANEYVTASFVRSVLNNGAFLYGTTNTIAVGFSNILTSSTNKISLQFGANAPSGYTKGFTNFVTGTYPNGPYFASIVSTNTYQAITGPFVNDFYIQADGSGAGHALSIAPDIFVTYDLTNLIPISSGSGQVLTMGSTTNLYTWIQAAAQYNSTNTAGFYIVRRVRVTSQNGTALYINVKGGSGTATTLAFNTPVTVNVNYSGTFAGNGSGLTNIASTNITGLGTAAYSNSTAFASSGVTNLTAGQIATISAAVTNGASPNFNFITSTNLLVTQANTNIIYFQFTNSANNISFIWGTNKYYGNAFGYVSYLTNDMTGIPAGQQWSIYLTGVPSYGTKQFYYTTNLSPITTNWVYVGVVTGTGLTNSIYGTNNVISTSTGNLVSSGSFTGNGSGLTNIPATGIVGTAVTNSASPTFTGLSVGAQTALDVNGNGNFGGVGLTNGVLTGNGSGITNVSASLPSGVASLAIGSLSLTNAIILRTNTSLPTLVTNATTLISSASIDSTSNEGLLILNFLTSGSAQTGSTLYFTITMAQPALSTNPMVVIPMPIIGTNLLSIGNGTINRFIVNSFSNSFQIFTGGTVPIANTTYQIPFLIYRR